jgi:hypothetical protein
MAVDINNHTNLPLFFVVLPPLQLRYIPLFRLNQIINAPLFCGIENHL